MATIIEMPKLSDTMTTGTVVKWHKQVGDSVFNGDILAEIETDKATMELENFDDGILLSLYVEEGEEVDIGYALAAVGQEGEAVPEIRIKEPEKTASTLEKEEFREEIVESSLPDVSLETDSDRSSPQGGGRLLASPLAKKIAREQNIDLSNIKGSGAGGRITRKDLFNLAPSQMEQEVVSPLPSTYTGSGSVFSGRAHSRSLEEKRVPVTKMRSIIAKRLLESKTTIPHFYLQRELDARPLRLSRESINRKLSLLGENIKVSLNDFILKACAASIPWAPEINSSWGEDHINFHKEVNLAFGVAVDDGLVTPVIRNADCKSLVEISREAKDLINRARTKKLPPDEMSGSTFTVTNLGMFGIDFFSGIINPPNAAILSVGSSQRKVVPSPDGTIELGERMVLGLSCDHRLVDGAVAAKFFQVLADTLECPASLLV